MIANQFEYKKANSIEDALGMMSEDAQILGGGHSLIPAMKLGLNMPVALIDVSKIETLKGIKDDGDTIVIGAATTHAEIAGSKLLSDTIPMMVKAASAIGDIQVRNVGTIGGSMAHADPAADWPAVLIASGAMVHLQNSSGKREVAIDDFFTGFFETALQEGELITAIAIPKNAANKNSAYVKFKQPASRFAIVGCAAAIHLNGGTVQFARTGLTGVSESAYRVRSVEQALSGKPLNEEIIDAAIADVTESRMIMSDHYASEKYRTHLAKVYVKRALMALV